MMWQFWVGWGRSEVGLGSIKWAPEMASVREIPFSNKSSSAAFYLPSFQHLRSILRLSDTYQAEGRGGESGNPLPEPLGKGPGDLRYTSCSWSGGLVCT